MERLRAAWLPAAELAVLRSLHTPFTTKSSGLERLAGKAEIGVHAQLPQQAYLSPCFALTLQSHALSSQATAPLGRWTQDQPQRQPGEGHSALPTTERLGGAPHCDR